jgi:hypothetical protein
MGMLTTHSSQLTTTTTNAHRSFDHYSREEEEIWHNARKGYEIKKGRGDLIQDWPEGIALLLVKKLS